MHKIDVDMTQWHSACKPEVVNLIPGTKKEKKIRAKQHHKSYKDTHKNVQEHMKVHINIYLLCLCMYECVYFNLPLLYQTGKIGWGQKKGMGI